MTYKRRSNRLSRNRRRWGTEGAVQIEFVLSFLVIMFTIFGIWELVMVVHTMNVLSDAAKEGVRYAIVHGGGNANCSGPSPPETCTNPDVAGDRIVTLVRTWAQYTLHDIDAISVNVSYPDGTTEVPSRVRVEVVYTFVPYTALPIRPAIRTVSEGRILY